MLIQHEYPIIAQLCTYISIMFLSFIYLTGILSISGPLESSASFTVSGSPWSGTFKKTLQKKINSILCSFEYNEKGRSCVVSIQINGCCKFTDPKI